MTQIYALTDPVTGEIRYIGKANDAAKRLKSHLRDACRRRTPVYAWVRKLVAAGQAPGLVVLAECAPEQWQELEVALIAEHRRGGRLLNVADGGEEPHCPLQVRQANGRAIAAKRNEVVTGLLARLGSDAKWFAARGDEVRAEKSRQAQHRLRAMDSAQREAFASAWRASGKWCPGARHGEAR